MEGSSSNATLAMLHSLCVKGLEVPSTSYSTREVGVNFPGIVAGIDGVLAAKILDSIPRAEDWRLLNQLTLEELAKRASTYELQVQIHTFSMSIPFFIIFLNY